MKKLLLFSFLFLPFVDWAQCAMCRTQVKNNVSHGETAFAESLNHGIMFLFFTPYIVLFVMIFLWKKFSKKQRIRFNFKERLNLH